MGLLVYCMNSPLVDPIPGKFTKGGHFCSDPRQRFCPSASFRMDCYGTIISTMFYHEVCSTGWLGPALTADCLTGPRLLIFLHLLPHLSFCVYQTIIPQQRQERPLLRPSVSSSQSHPHPVRLPARPGLLALQHRHRRTKPERAKRIKRIPHDNLSFCSHFCVFVPPTTPLWTMYYSGICWWHKHLFS